MDVVVRLTKQKVRPKRPNLEMCKILKISFMTEVRQ